MEMRLSCKSFISCYTKSNSILYIRNLSRINRYSANQIPASVLKMVEGFLAETLNQINLFSHFFKGIIETTKTYYVPDSV